MRSALFAVAALAALAVASARCPGGCSGHGSCGTNDLCTCWKNWQGAACSERTCEFGVSWASAGSDPHKYAECSAKGTCDRDTGLCACVEGYTGLACERSACPGDCSGHGKCRLVQDLSSGYVLWDAAKIQGCVCDGGYTGADCAQRLCPKGDDPLSVCNSANKHQVQTIYVRGSPRVSLGAFAGAPLVTPPNGGPVYKYNGDLAIHFTDNTGEEWITNKVADIFGSGATTEVTKALKALPNYRIPAVTVTSSNADPSTRAIQVTFNDGRVSGNQALFTFDSPLGCQVAGCHPKYYQPQLTTITLVAGGGSLPTAGGVTDVKTWSITDDSVFDTSLIASGDLPAAGTFGSTTFRALVTVQPSNGAATEDKSKPAHAYKVNWDLSKRYDSGTTGTELYFVHLYGTVVSDDTTFTLTFRGRTTAPITWGTVAGGLPARATRIETALEKPAMELGGDVTVTCYPGFDVTAAGGGLMTAVGVNAAYCTILLRKLVGIVASNLIVSASFGSTSVNAGASSGKYLVETGTAAASGTLFALGGKASAALAGPSCAVASGKTAIYTATQTAFGVDGPVLAVCDVAGAGGLVSVFYSSPTGERIVATTTATPVTPAAITFSGGRVQVITSYDSTGTTLTPLANTANCVASYAGATVTLASGAQTVLTSTDFGLALNTLGLGSFTSTATTTAFTVTYNSPAIGTIGLTCTGTDATKVIKVTTTTEQALRTDTGAALGQALSDFTVALIPWTTLPDTRDSTTGAGRSRVPIGYGMYLSLPAEYYNQAWVGAHFAANPFMVEVTVDIGSAWAAQTTAASVDVEDAECSNRGHCDRTTGTCACYEGYYGDHCGLQTILV